MFELQPNGEEWEPVNNSESYGSNFINCRMKQDDSGEILTNQIHSQDHVKFIR